MARIGYRLKRSSDVMTDAILAIFDILEFSPTLRSMSDTVTVPEEWIESVTELTFPESTDRRMQDLMDRNNQGALSAEERKELQALVAMGEELSLVRAQAFRFLHRDPAGG